MKAEDKINKQIIFWLQRVLDEKTTDLNKISKRISTLNYQSHNYNEMRSEIDQQTVVKDLIKDMREYGWEESILELTNLILDK